MRTRFQIRVQKYLNSDGILPTTVDSKRRDQDVILNCWLAELFQGVYQKTLCISVEPFFTHCINFPKPKVIGQTAVIINIVVMKGNWHPGSTGAFGRLALRYY